jgi:MEMO1 family protein
MPKVRKPAVAGTFYPGEPQRLSAQITSLLDEVQPAPVRPKAIIAPHAGYLYSGPIAASAYALLAPMAPKIRRVVLLGPSHFVPFRGLALPDVDAFATPLGEIRLDADAVESVRSLPQVSVLDAAHTSEHSLEVQLPFLQMVLGDFTLVPLAVGDALPEDVAEVLEWLWGGDETLVVISSDLSHYHPYGQAVAIDLETTEAIERLDGRYLTGEHACGCFPIRGLLHLAKRRGLRVQTIDRRNSGDTAGDRERVVGYGAWAFSEGA